MGVHKQEHAGKKNPHTVKHYIKSCPDFHATVISREDEVILIINTNYGRETHLLDNEGLTLPTIQKILKEKFDEFMKEIEATAWFDSF